MLKLADSWKSHETFCVTTTEVSQKTLEKYGKVFVVGECNYKYPIRVIKVPLCCIKITFKQKPDVIISTGAVSSRCVV